MNRRERVKNSKAEGRGGYGALAGLCHACSRNISGVATVPLAGLINPAMKLLSFRSVHLFSTGEKE
jgi:hypothetical protein